MQIDFYKCSDDIRVLHKTMTDKKSVTGCEITGTVSMLQPTFVLQYDSTLLPYNYMYIDTFGIWYHVNDIIINPAGQMLVTGTADPLFTYANEISDCVGVAVRSGSGFTNVPDTAYPIDPVQEFCTSYLFDSSDLDPPAILPEYSRKFLLALK